MHYLKCRWLHQDPDEPIVLYHEIDDEGWELRKIEVYATGIKAYASEKEQTLCFLSETKIPNLDEINADKQFEAVETSKAEFEKAWSTRTNLDTVDPDKTWLG